MKHLVTICTMLFWGIVLFAVSHGVGSIIAHFAGKDISFLFKALVGALFIFGVVATIAFIILIVCVVHDLYVWIYRKLEG